ncbi:hypothetical protein ACFBZI_08535 [Moraxella sp. ZJ142]|uniref:hypothetical protein n=1 Tax=Moraxella marmotae TaxID=3344520 RepID=UPI0035D4470D
MSKNYTHKKVGATRAEQRRHDKHREGFEKELKTIRRNERNAQRRKSNGGAGG